MPYPCTTVLLKPLEIAVRPYGQAYVQYQMPCRARYSMFVKQVTQQWMRARQAHVERTEARGRGRGGVRPQPHRIRVQQPDNTCTHLLSKTVVQHHLDHLC